MQSYYYTDEDGDQLRANFYVHGEDITLIMDVSNATDAGPSVALDRAAILAFHAWLGEQIGLDRPHEGGNKLSSNQGDATIVPLRLWDDE